MRLTFDLRLESHRAAEPGERLVSLDDLAGLAREPSALARLLWGRRWDEVAIEVDTGSSLSTVQTGVIGLAALARARRFAGAPRAVWLLRGAARMLVALPRELVLSRRLLRAARNAIGRDWSLPSTVARPRSLLYVRGDPRLRWHGQMVGGASTHTSGVINGFAVSGLAVEVFAAERPEWTEHVRFTQVPIRHALHFVPWLTTTAYGDGLARAAAPRSVDFVYQRNALGSYAGLQLAASHGIPLVLEYNGSELWVHKNWGSGRGVPYFDVALGIEQVSLRAASLVVVVSDVLKQEVVEQGVDPARVLVNPNGVDIERVARFREHEPSHWRAKAGLPEAPMIGFVGSFGLWHGVTVLPAIVEELAKTDPDARWVIVGDGSLRAQVEEDIEQRGLGDRVQLTGMVSHAEALALLAASDVCVSPHIPNPDGTRFFGSPTKLFEYMGLAKPIVASDLEQLGEVIADGSTGVLVPPGDAAAAAAAISRLLHDPADRRRLGDAAFESARTEYSWTAHTRRILDALAG